VHGVNRVFGGGEEGGSLANTFLADVYALCVQECERINGELDRLTAAVHAKDTGALEAFRGIRATIEEVGSGVGRVNCLVLIRMSHSISFTRAQGIPK
jgi:hypothetical protein